MSFACSTLRAFEGKKKGQGCEKRNVAFHRKIYLKEYRVTRIEKWFHKKIKLNITYFNGTYRFGHSDHVRMIVCRKIKIGQR